MNTPDNHDNDGAPAPAALPEALTGAALPFIETALARRIWRTINSARRYNRFAFIFGESQIGKTAAVSAYAATHERTLLLRMPASPTLSMFARGLAARLGAPAYFTRAAAREWIMSKLTKDDVIIVDEAHQAILTERRLSPRDAKIFEFIREIHDVTRCGVVLVATNILRDAIGSGRIAGVMAQTVRRSTFSLVCPDQPSAEDLNAFAAAYGLAPAALDVKVLQQNRVRERGLGMWLTLLRMAASVAAQKKRPPSWDDVVEADRALRRVESRRAA